MDEKETSLSQFTPKLEEGKSILECVSHKGRTARERAKNAKRLNRRFVRDHTRIDTKPKG